jgi:L,D-peptidoglycan transpeptidase YkuD (ErfK/YbiS/YcfS/YnhG family)
MVCLVFYFVRAIDGGSALRQWILMAHDIYVRDGNTLAIAGKSYPCVIGKSGLAAVGEKREGDGKTPRGVFPLRQVYYRPDRVKPPQTRLPIVALKPSDGWCDDPADAAYNTYVTLPFAASHEQLWREDHAYDLILVVGYNDAPAQPGKGSAIFMHLRHDDGRGTEGCVALSEADMREVLAVLTPGSRICIE